MLEIFLKFFRMQGFRLGALARKHGGEMLAPYRPAILPSSAAQILRIRQISVVC
jgi:hypothetical protein